MTYIVYTRARGKPRSAGTASRSGVALGGETGDAHNHFGSLLEVGDGQEFVRAVEVQAAGEDVGAGQTHERELRSIRGGRWE